MHLRLFEHVQGILEELEPIGSDKSRDVAVKGSTDSVKIEQVCIHGRPIGHLSCHDMFVESFVIHRSDPSNNYLYSIRSFQ